MIRVHVHVAPQPSQSMDRQCSTATHVCLCVCLCVCSAGAGEAERHLGDMSSGERGRPHWSSVPELCGNADYVHVHTDGVEAVCMYVCMSVCVLAW